jgi:hypothetical protein
MPSIKINTPPTNMQLASSKSPQQELGQLVLTRLVRPCLVLKNFRDSSSHQIFGDMHRALNVDEKKLITQFGRKQRDEYFEPI